MSGSSNPPRKHSAFDVLLGKRKQPSTPPSPALQSLQRAVSKAGGTLSPIADSPAAKRIHTPTGVSCPSTTRVLSPLVFSRTFSSKNLPRHVDSAHLEHIVLATFKYKFAGVIIRSLPHLQQVGATSAAGHAHQWLHRHARQPASDAVGRRRRRLGRNSAANGLGSPAGCATASRA